MKKLARNAQKLTATNNATFSTHSATITIGTYPKSISTSALRTPHIVPNLVSAHDLASRYGAVVFSKDKARLMTTGNDYQQARIASALWDGQFYELILNHKNDAKQMQLEVPGAYVVRKYAPTTVAALRSAILGCPES